VTDEARMDRPDAIECRFYTHGRRHPIVIGNIQGLRIPPITPAQLALAVGSGVVLASTRALWAHFGPVANGLAFVAVPVGLAWAARAVRMEGRAPWRAGLGWLQQITSPTEGVCLGRRDRPMRPVRYRTGSWVGDLVTTASPPAARRPAGRRASRTKVVGR
jgi:hypothetical protein